MRGPGAESCTRGGGGADGCNVKLGYLYIIKS